MEVPSIFLDKILREAAQKKARSVYLTVSSYPILRVKNELITFEEEVINREKIEKIIQSFLSQEELEKLKKDKELIVVKNFLSDYRFRVNIFYQKNYPSVTFHYISREQKNLKNLGLPPAFSDLIQYNSGLLVLTGPNNSGKTTTAASVIEEVNKQKKNYIVTLEKPIEYIYVNKKSIINQREIGRDVQSYEEGLLNCLEEDVDLVYLGELREEFEKAVPFLMELAAGNCLVILEMDTEHSVRAIEKILSALRKQRPQEAATYFLADVLIGILAQKLIPNKKNELSLAIELLIVNTPVKSLIRENNIYQINNIIQNHMSEGMVNMSKSIRDLIADGAVDEEEVKRWNFDMQI